MILYTFLNISFLHISHGEWLEFSGTIISALIGFLGTLLVIHYTINNAKKLISHENEENDRRNVATIERHINSENNAVNKLKPKLKEIRTNISIDNMNENVSDMKSLYNFCKDILSKLRQTNTNILIYQNEIVNNITHLSKFNESYYNTLNDKLIHDYYNYREYIEDTIKSLATISFHSRYDTDFQQGFKNATISETLMPKLNSAILKLSQASYNIQNSVINH